MKIDKVFYGLKESELSTTLPVSVLFKFENVRTLMNKHVNLGRSASPARTVLTRMSHLLHPWIISVLRILHPVIDWSQIDLGSSASPVRLGTRDCITDWIVDKI
ncbi:Hypothetical protein NTJ_13799 [Nesidiocoris tenuis]|uniref:Uncharacterized protein n=1 Tax=Nesidiocoris tenuis TaxID=355587 RepID=A0ABN7BBE5_9HEMI|nr:Hypothetical protein NTJ_13799 [Nesidiocoris tenuis]